MYCLHSFLLLFFFFFKRKTAYDMRISDWSSDVCSSDRIDDRTGRTIASASSLEADLRGSATGNKDTAAKVGALLAERAKAAGVDKVVFDRGGNLYHGRVAAIAAAAREAGLEL